MLKFFKQIYNNKILIYLFFIINLKLPTPFVRPNDKSCNNVYNNKNKQHEGVKQPCKIIY